MAKEVTVLGIEGAFLRGVRLEERNGAFVCTEVESWPLVAGAADVTSAAASAGETPAIPMGSQPATPIDSATSADLSEEAPVEAVAEDDKPLARALRAAAKHFEQSEFSLAIPLSKLLVKGVRMPVEARDELLSAAKLELDGISPFPDEDLAPAAEVVAETDSGWSWTAYRRSPTRILRPRRRSWPRLIPRYRCLQRHCRRRPRPRLARRSPQHVCT